MTTGTAVDTSAVVTETAVTVSSSSSTCTRESDASDADLNVNAAVSLRQTSRQGRATQRWMTDPETNEPIRLVTGCVPILRGGKILFVSASRKAEWILPKGGWELDERMEESAVRETFEEAGVLGTLGPKLSMVQYETRKAKKRRMEQEEMLRQKRAKKEPEEPEDASKNNNKNNKVPEVVSPPVAVLTDEAMSRIQQDAKAMTQSEDSVSVASSSAPYTQVRMTLFPLYVSSVAGKWPESGRFRRAVDIDEAIEMTDNRPEFRAVLREIKHRGLHLVTEPNLR